ncbi:hypothetical protein HK104_008853 [Borealophlyctis nickersoniae]|nr:hypothetical protein HK104_008853 [Borealophlyctis nickersoniae]
MNHQRRHFYELIREGAPCRLYFDLEFEFEFNQHADPSSMIDTFKSFIIDEIHEHYGIHCTRDDIVDLTSTTDKKFSRHLIVHVPNAVFKNNAHVGQFVRRLWAKIEYMSREANEDGEERERARRLFVRDDKGEVRLFVDDGVYSRNRNFRIYLSSKIGKQSILLPSTESGKNPPKVSVDPDGGVAIADEDKSHYQFFLDSLVCAVGYDAGTRILTCGEGYYIERGKGAMKSAESEIKGGFDFRNNVLCVGTLIAEVEPRRPFFGLVVIFPLAATDSATTLTANTKVTEFITWLNWREVYLVNDCRHFRSVDMPIPLWLNPFASFPGGEEEGRENVNGVGHGEPQREETGGGEAEKSGEHNGLEDFEGGFTDSELWAMLDNVEEPEKD